jgi:5-methylthioadenosine/S-adenosylhomocysteine deaminase
VNPWTVLELATWRGAELIGLAETGRLQAGWKADVVVVDGGALAMEPAGDPAAMVVFGGGAGSVRHVVIDGKVVVEDGVLASGDKGVIRGEARTAAAAVSARLGWT